MENPFKNLSKPQLYAVAGGTLLIGGYVEFRHHKSSGSWNPFNAGTPSSTDAVDPLTGLPASQDSVVDPATGQTYLAEAQQYGSVQAAEQAVSAYGQSSGTGSGTGVQPASGGAGASTPAAGSVSSSTYTSDQAWAQAATAGLADVGFSQTDVASALGDYLTSTPVDADQAKLIRTALAEYGNPPSGSGHLIMAPVAKPVNNAPRAVPNVVGEKVDDAGVLIAAAGFKSHFPAGATSAEIVATQAPKAGVKAAAGATVSCTIQAKPVVPKPVKPVN